MRPCGLLSLESEVDHATCAKCAKIGKTCQGPLLEKIAPLD